MKYVFILFIFFIFGFLGVIMYKKYIVSRPQQEVKTPISKSAPFSLDIPPSESLEGILLSFSGRVDWQSRSATEPAKLTQKNPVLQGEEYWTKQNGTVQITFPETMRLQMYADTHINFIQTLPTNFVISQTEGKVTYENLSATTPVGIRVKHLVVVQQSGELTIAIKEDEPIITLRVLKGSITLAFNDTENVSNVITVDKGSIYTFDDEKRTGDITTDE